MTQISQGRGTEFTDERKVDRSLRLAGHFACVSILHYCRRSESASKKKGAGYVQPPLKLKLVEYPSELIRQQAEDGEGELSADVNLAVRHGRNGELHPVTGGTRAIGRTAVEQGADVRGVVGIQDRGCIILEAGVVDDPDDASSCSIRGNHGRAAANSPHSR